MRAAGRDVWVKIRASEAERAEWHAKASSAGLTLSDLVRRSVGRVRTWTVAHAEVERERTRELARIGANLNQIAHWANTFKANAEALEVVAHLVAIERALAALAPVGRPDPDAHQVPGLRHRPGRRPTTSWRRATRRAGQPSNARVPSSSASRDQAHNTSQTSSLWPAKSEEIP